MNPNPWYSLEERYELLLERQVLLQQRDEARRIARALYPLLAKLRALEEMPWQFHDEGKSVLTDVLDAWDALLFEEHKARDIIREQA